MALTNSERYSSTDGQVGKEFDEKILREQVHAVQEEIRQSPMVDPVPKQASSLIFVQQCLPSTSAGGTQYPERTGESVWEPREGYESTGQIPTLATALSGSPLPGKAGCSNQKGTGSSAAISGSPMSGKARCNNQTWAGSTAAPYGSPRPVSAGCINQKWAGSTA